MFVCVENCSDDVVGDIVGCVETCTGSRLASGVVGTIVTALGVADNVLVCSEPRDGLRELSGMDP